MSHSVICHFSTSLSSIHDIIYSSSKHNHLNRLNSIQFNATILSSFFNPIIQNNLHKFIHTSRYDDFIGHSYNTGVMNAPEKVVFPGHSTLEWSLAVAAFAVGGPLGAIMGGRMADSRGRRGALLMDTWTFLLGGLLQTFAFDMVTIIIARFIIGFASGFSSVLVPIYLGELAPPSLRGMLGTVTQFALVVGILAANLIAFPFAKEGQWRILFGITVIVAVGQLLTSPFLLESPRWLLGRDPKSLKARYILKSLRGLRYDHEVETEVGHIMMGGAAQQQEQPSMMGTLREMLGHSQSRLLLFSSLVLQMGQQFSGINAVFYYSTSFFEGVYVVLDGRFANNEQD